MKKFVFWVVGLVLTGVILAAGLGLFWRFGSTNYLLTGVPILNYHQVNDKFQTVLTMKPADFEEQMKYLHDHGLSSRSRLSFDHTGTVRRLYARRGQSPRPSGHDHL